MKNQKPAELSKKKKVYMQNFLAWLLEQPENMVYNITNKLGEFKMKQKKSGTVTLEMIYGELIEFKTTQQAWNKKQEEFNEKVIVRLDSLENKVDAILECPTIKREIKLP